MHLIGNQVSWLAHPVPGAISLLQAMEVLVGFLKLGKEGRNGGQLPPGAVAAVESYFRGWSGSELGGEEAAVRFWKLERG